MAKEIAVTKETRVPRIDGPLKCTGSAMYTSDHHFPKLAFGVPVCAKIAKGKVKSLDFSRAKKMKGVLAVYTHENIGPIYRCTPEAGMEFRVDEPRPPFEDTIIRYYGQYIALVVAETFEIAQNAARSVVATYDAEKPNVSGELKQEDLKKQESARGDANKAFENAAVKIDQTYVTPVEVHNPIEMHSTVAVWEGAGEDERVRIYETSQAINTHRNVIAQMLGLPRERTEVISKFLGSGFGGKLWLWPHSALAAVSARKLRRPVKIVVDRQMMFWTVGHRPRTQQKIRIGANKSGELQALAHEYASQGAMQGDYKENCGEVSGFLYKIPNVLISSGVARRNQGTPTSMRGPGAVPGLFALESALDELAVALKMDPVKLRLTNDTQIDDAAGKPFSSRHLKECLELGAEKFGWSKRNPEVASMKDGEEILGWGVASCTWQSQRLDADATVEFMPNGRIRVRCGTHDIGTGMYTVLAQITHEETSQPMNQIDVELGDTSLPAGPIAGGSMATGSVVPALVQAVRGAKKNLLAAATQSPSSPFHELKPDQLELKEGKITTSQKGGLSMGFGELIRKMNLNSVMSRGTSKGNFASKGTEKFSTKSFGAHFVEVGWNPSIARLRVRRVVTVIDGGRIVNYVPAKNQIEGAIVMGIGMGMLERAEYDARDGNVVNSNLADYIVAVHADCPDIDVSFLDYPDKEVNEYGARGVGEIGLAGIAAAITGAVYHATGVRVRELPVKIEDLLV